MPTLPPRKKPAPQLAKRPEPLWRGPHVDGVTQSLLSQFIVCRERFRLYVIEGLREQRTFGPSMEYGNMWHACEEAHAQGVPWDAKLRDYVRDLCLQWPMNRGDISHWFEVCKRQFPIYVRHWSQHDDMKGREPLLQEHEFKVPIALPSGRNVLLRGKWDSVDLVRRAKTATIYAQENKTKGDIDAERLKMELPWDLQTNVYLIALHAACKQGLLKMEGPIAGVRYNVVRRPLAGGKHSIQQRKGRKTKKGLVGVETAAQFYQRLGGIIQDNPEHFFMRWNVELPPSDLAKFRKECLDPLLEDLCDWWDATSAAWHRGDDPFTAGKSLRHGSAHWRTPFGVYNPLLEGRPGGFHEYLLTGNKRGLDQVDTVFPELTNA